MSFAERFALKASNGSFVAKIIRNKALIYHLCFPVMGKSSWFILEVTASKHKEFKAHMQSTRPIELTDYGKILYSGWGEEPDEKLKFELQNKYGLYD